MPCSAGGGGYLHVLVTVDTEDGAILGLIDARGLGRTRGRRVRRLSAPVEGKESVRWLQGADAAASVCAGAASVTMGCDREGDLFEAFALCP